MKWRIKIEIPVELFDELVAATGIPEKVYGHLPEEVEQAILEGARLWLAAKKEQNHE